MFSQLQRGLTECMAIHDGSEGILQSARSSSEAGPSSKALIFIHTFFYIFHENKIAKRRLKTRPRAPVAAGGRIFTHTQTPPSPCAHLAPRRIKAGSCRRRSAHFAADEDGQALGAHERALGALVADEVREGEVGEGRGRDAGGEEADDGGGEGSRLSEGQRGVAGRVLDGAKYGARTHPWHPSAQP